VLEVSDEIHGVMMERVECAGGGVPRAYQDGPLTLQDSPEKRTLRNSGLVPILLQKSFCTRDRNFPGRRSGFRVEMWGTSLPGDKLTSDFGNEPEATSAGDRDLFRLLAGNLSPGVLGLLQQNLPIPDSCSAAKSVPIGQPSQPPQFLATGS
jgi:hypothetical protein